MSFRTRITAVLTGVTLAAGTALLAGAPADAQPLTDQPTLQQRADQVLQSIPGGKQVSPTRIEYDGLTVTLDREVRTGRPGKVQGCAYGNLCVNVRGTNFIYYKCQTWTVSNWYGNGTFENNQTPGTVARFYNQDGSVRFTSTAYQSGTATWDPIYSLRPC
jgi:hypothetical protein